MKNNFYYLLDCVINSLKFNGFFRGTKVVLITINYKFINKLNKKNYVRILGMKFSYLNKVSVISMLYDLFCSGTYYFKSENSKPIIIDIGANLGDSILYFKWIYPKSVIHAFEPNVKAFNVLQKNVTENKFVNVYLYNVGLGKKNQKKKLFSNKDETFYTSSLLRESFKLNQELISNTVEIKNLTKMKILEKYDQIDLIKMDVEGSEREILSSLSDVLKKTRNVILEYHMVDDMKNNSFDEIVRSLTVNNFEVNIFGSFRNIVGNTNPNIFFIKGARNE